MIGIFSLWAYASTINYPNIIGTWPHTDPNGLRDLANNKPYEFFMGEYNKEVKPTNPLKKDSKQVLCNPALFGRWLTTNYGSGGKNLSYSCYTESKKEPAKQKNRIDTLIEDLTLCKRYGENGKFDYTSTNLDKKMCDELINLFNATMVHANGYCKEVIDEESGNAMPNKYVELIENFDYETDVDDHNHPGKQGKNNQTYYCNSLVKHLQADLKWLSEVKTEDDKGTTKYKNGKMCFEDDGTFLEALGDISTFVQRKDLQNGIVLSVTKILMTNTCAKLLYQKESLKTFHQKLISYSRPPPPR